MYSRKKEPERLKEKRREEKRREEKRREEKRTEEKRREKKKRGSLKAKLPSQLQSGLTNITTIPIDQISDKNMIPIPSPSPVDLCTKRIKVEK